MKDKRQILLYVSSGDILHRERVLDVFNDASNLDKHMSDTHKYVRVEEV